MTRAPRRSATFATAAAVAVAIASFSATAVQGRPNRYGPEKLTQIASDTTGTVILAAGTHTDCKIWPVYLRVTTRHSPAATLKGMDLPLFDQGVPSDYGDLWGHVSALNLPAGEYEIYPTIGTLRPNKTPRFIFTVRPNTVTYLGNLLIEVCWRRMIEFRIRDQSSEDLEIAREKNPALKNVEIQTGLLAFAPEYPHPDSPSSPLEQDPKH